MLWAPDFELRLYANSMWAQAQVPTLPAGMCPNDVQLLRYPSQLTSVFSFGTGRGARA